MSVRSDVSVDWNASPREITVASPSTTITIPDLRETLRDLEWKPTTQSYPSLLSAAGNVVIDADTGARAIYFVTLFNAIVGFEARPGPSFTGCKISEGTLTAVDTDGITGIDPILTTAYVQVNYANATTGAVVPNSLTQQDADLVAVTTLDGIVDPSNPVSVRDSLFAILATLTGIATGGGTTSITFRNHGDTADAVIMTVDENGNRSAVTINFP